MHKMTYCLSTKYIQALCLLSVLVLLSGCLAEEAAEQKEAVVSDAKSSHSSVVTSGTLLAPENCAPGEATVITGYYNFPAKQCIDIANQVATDLSNKGYRNRCGRKTNATKRPASVARAQVNECGALKQGQGSYASVQICCAVPVKSAPEKIIAYEAKLDCPDDNIKALATGLHYPQQSCSQVAGIVGTKLSSAHYQRACANAVSYGSKLKPVLDAATFSCRDNAGAILDVAVCCAATKSANRPVQTLSVPADIWAVLASNDLFGLQLLLSRQPERVQDIGVRGITPLHRAANVAIVNALLAKRANREAQDDDGFTPLHAAVQARLTPVVERLLAVGAKVDAVSKYADTPLSFAANVELAQVLLQYQANPNGLGAAGPLHAAAFYGRYQVAELLLKQGANINQRDANGETPLHRAAFRQKIELVRLLIASGADIKIKSHSGRTALEMTDNTEIGVLLSSKANVLNKKGV